ncbi:MAG: hypothetical protein N2169_03400 [bacterium]|nr:hypothetical protein [bacterium]
MSRMLDILERALQVRKVRTKRKKVRFSTWSDNSQVSKGNFISVILSILFFWGMCEFVDDILVSLGLEVFVSLVFGCMLIFFLPILLIFHILSFILLDLIYAFCSKFKNVYEK